MIRTSVAPTRWEEAKAGQIAHCLGNILSQASAYCGSFWVLRPLLFGRLPTLPMRGWWFASTLLASSSKLVTKFLGALSPTELPAHRRPVGPYLARAGAP